MQTNLKKFFRKNLQYRYRGSIKIDTGNGILDPTFQETMNGTDWINVLKSVKQELDLDKLFEFVRGAGKENKAA